MHLKSLLKIKMIYFSAFKFLKCEHNQNVLCAEIVFGYWTAFQILIDWEILSIQKCSYLKNSTVFIIEKQTISVVLWYVQ